MCSPRLFSREMGRNLCAFKVVASAADGVAGQLSTLCTEETGDSLSPNYSTVGVIPTT
jgi:hypothetical protein